MNNNAPMIRESHAMACAFDDNKKQLLKQTICKGSSDDEFELFLHACQRTGLDPFMKQIYAVKRWDSNLKREAMTIQTGIDGFRLIAERTGRYCPGRESTFNYDKEGNLISATSYVKKQTNDGTWHEVSVTAYYDEYCQRTKEGKPMAMWGKIPHIMLSKCAESLALRKCFPGDLSGIYTKEEMNQADVEIIQCKADLHEKKELVDPQDARALEMAIGDDQEYLDKILRHYQIDCLDSLEKKNFGAVYSRAMAHIAKKKMVSHPVLPVEASVFEVVQ